MPPKYSYEILAIEFVLLVACVTCLYLDEYRLYAYLFVAYVLTCGIQLLRLKKARRRLDHELVELRQDIERHHQNKGLTICEIQDMDAALEGLREDIKRHKRAKDET